MVCTVNFLSPNWCICSGRSCTTIRAMSPVTLLKSLTVFCVKGSDTIPSL
ncbi:hypothetical protein SLEP1_g21432 [Rubroshorea leprosula]|uniref:Uncharacterized protein n=1 Tax=Rubroshorea leprosula TaxID=152421 RepID=A0AAV5JEP1_9ROSI|nr:hypothetical protein SLEP1_g21432 [Rubroshorea leprosula]